MPLPFYTVGHSTRSIEEFVVLLRVAEVELLVDIRSVPRSRRNPQYNADVLASELAPHGIGWERIAELGGLRGHSKMVPPGVNGFWENESFHNYADYALSDAFRTGFDRLVTLGRERRCAVMCAEAVWWRCHRRIVADHLLARGETVFHLMGEGRIEPARLTAGARIEPSGMVVYPARPDPPVTDRG
ncbi:MAG: DUF488 domain-containing protein [Gammaproteobacteria bacterium]|nr:DUF488 domain-containing protein [Gammaproteobacteria bacterium]